MKSEVGADLLAYPDLPSTQLFRHICIIQRRPRANAPAFIGAPIPHRCRGEGARASMITITYFHSWTLRSEKVDAYVPYAGEIRPCNMSWEEAMTAWLDGNVISRDSARYAADFFSVYEFRPRDDEEDVRSDETSTTNSFVLQHHI